MNHQQSEVWSAEKSSNQSFSLQERKRDSVIKAILSEDILHIRRTKCQTIENVSRWDKNWDMREPGEEEKRRGYLPSATRHLLLIRCGNNSYHGTQG